MYDEMDQLKQVMSNAKGFNGRNIMMIVLRAKNSNPKNK